ncbi:MAG: ATP-binding protein [bacterium]
MALLKSSKPIELKQEELKWKCDPEIFEVETSDSLEPVEGIIGQQRALKALNLGVDLKSPGYNIFITGLSGTGKATTIKRMLENISPKCPQLSDYLYVNNFKDPDQPTLIVLKAGQGAKFKNDISKTIKFIQEKIPIVLESDPFTSQKKKLLTDFGTSQQKVLDDFEDRLRTDGFTLGQVKVGELVRPEILIVIEDQAIFIQNLDEAVKSGKITRGQSDVIIDKYTGYQQELQSLFRQNFKITQDFHQKVNELEAEAVKSLINVTIDDLKKKYKDKKVSEYLNHVTESIFQNLDKFKALKTADHDEENTMPENMIEYEVNLILDNSEVKECPVVIETTPTYNNLFGTIEKYSDGSGGWYADFTRIKAGSLLHANNGYLVINALDAFSEPGVWKTLKRVLLYGTHQIQDVANLYMYAPSILKPEQIEINTKIIFIGNSYIYYVLSNYEDDFNKLFKVKADFDYEMKRNESTILQYAQVVKKLIDDEKLLKFDKSALSRIVEYGIRYAGSKDKLTTRFAYIADLVREANFWARDVGAKSVTDFHVAQAYDGSRERHGLYESKLQEYIQEGTILIDTENDKVGQINGLAVYGGGQYSFGKPARITASVSLGGGNILNVEREAGLSGNTHNKGMLIITGYFKEKFGKKIPLSFNASLVFEQGYGMIDGDSASITEICALLSSISGIPIKQNIAITGSVNQKGEIQPIGGVNEKIEGFFDVCKARGWTGKHGVIIPIQNVKDLMLKDEVIEEVKNNNFHIYPVSIVEEAVEILTGIKAGHLLKNESYTANTVFGEVERSLKLMRKRIKEPPKKNSKGEVKSKAKAKPKSKPKSKPKK